MKNVYNLKTVKIEDIRDLTKEEVKEKIRHYLNTRELDEELDIYIFIKRNGVIYEKVY